MFRSQLLEFALTKRSSHIQITHRRSRQMKRPAASHDKRKAVDSQKKPPAKRPGNAPKGENKRAKNAKQTSHLPVSTLCGFLGAGKTTLLKHILETKHLEADLFRCAVIVNDMAELNIDKTLIDRTAFVQSDEVIAMQNGCVCCTLQSDLVDQMIVLAKKKCFDYMIIEASGVSEPSQIARLFAECKDHDNHKPEESHEALNDVARLDTCVTVVDCGDFFNNLTTVKAGPQKQSFPQLLVEQIEYANVIILNKTDLVNQAQLEDIKEQLYLLNPRARLLTCQNSRVDVMQVVNTQLYNAKDFEETLQKIEKCQEVSEKVETWEKPCCVEMIQKGQVACCKPSEFCKPAQPASLETGISEVVLCKPPQQTRHEARFGITSFLYHARRPFHPVRLEEQFVTKFFVMYENEADGKQTKKEVLRRQKEANEKQKVRTAEMGSLLRSKGFLWIANRHDVMTIYSQAASVLTIESPERWLVLQAEAWEGTEAERAAFRKDFREPWGDRRQDLVFIGKELKHQNIQKILDNCLLTDEEMAMGVDGWKATMGDVYLDANSDEE